VIETLELQEIQEEIPHKAFTAIKQFRDLIHEARSRFKQGKLAEQFDWLMKSIDYQKVIKDETSSEKGEKFRFENLEQLKILLNSYEKEDKDPSLDGFIHSILLDSKNADFASSESSQKGVNLLTFHSSKGLEFPVCFIVGVEDHILPHEKSLSGSGIEEERRLFYVAITRAKLHLSISMARIRKRIGKEMPSNPSRFLFEIPKETLKPSLWNLP
jgi:superfamily I DNA/RNA helicase